MTPRGNRYVPPYAIAIIYAGLGQKEDALDWLEKAYEMRNQWLGLLKVSPEMDILRPEPRFQDLVRRVGLLP